MIYMLGTMLEYAVLSLPPLLLRPLGLFHQNLHSDRFVNRHYQSLSNTKYYLAMEADNRLR